MTLDDGGKTRGKDHLYGLLRAIKVRFPVLHGWRYWAVAWVLARPTVLMRAHSALTASTARSRRGCEVSPGLEEIPPPYFLTETPLQELPRGRWCVRSCECLQWLLELSPQPMGTGA